MHPNCACPVPRTDVLLALVVALVQTTFIQDEQPTKKHDAEKDPQQTNNGCPRMLLLCCLCVCFLRGGRGHLRCGRVNFLRGLRSCLRTPSRRAEVRSSPHYPLVHTAEPLGVVELLQDFFHGVVPREVFFPAWLACVLLNFLPPPQARWFPRTALALHHRRRGGSFFVDLARPRNIRWRPSGGAVRLAVLTTAVLRRLRILLHDLLPAATAQYVVDRGCSRSRRRIRTFGGRLVSVHRR